MTKPLRVAIIGHTGRGDYGHYLDRAFTGVAETEIVALADHDEQGRLAAMARSGAQRGYADYQEMLRVEQPDIAVVASREDRRSSGDGAGCSRTWRTRLSRKTSGGLPGRG